MRRFFALNHPLIATARGISATNLRNKRQERLERSVTKSRNFAQRRDPVVGDDANGTGCIVNGASKSDRTNTCEIRHLRDSVYPVYSREFAGNRPVFVMPDVTQSTAEFRKDLA